MNEKGYDAQQTTIASSLLFYLRVCSYVCGSSSSIRLVLYYMTFLRIFISCVGNRHSTVQTHIIISILLFVKHLFRSNIAKDQTNMPRPRHLMWSYSAFGLMFENVLPSISYLLIFLFFDILATHKFYLLDFFLFYLLFRVVNESIGVRGEL